MGVIGVTAAELASAGFAPPPLLQGMRARLAWHDDLAMPDVIRLYTKSHTFFSTCEGVREDESTGFFTPTPTQLLAFDHIHRNKWSNIKKGRQAKITTAVGLGVLLRDCMYLEGMQGVLIADTRDTAEMIFERLVFAYERLPNEIKMPLARGKRPATRHIKFVHGGGIAVLTMGSKAPAVGRSVGRFHITEFGEAKWQKEAAANMFPTVAKRRYAMVILEGTPGRAGSIDHVMWQKSLIGRGRFAPLFLPWHKERANEEPIWGPEHTQLRELCDRHSNELIEWQEEREVAGEVANDIVDDVAVGNFGDLPENVRRDVIATMLDGEETRYIEDIPDISFSNVIFRRDALDTEFAGDPRLFSAKFPKDPHDGWVGSLHPVMPSSTIKGMLAEAKPDGAFDLGPSGCLEIHPPQANACHLITGDPTHYGETGDPAGIAVWMVSDTLLRLVAFWLGRDDPGRLAARAKLAQERYSTRMIYGEPTMIAMESNTQGCIQSLLDSDTDGLYWSKRDKPGWWASEANNLRAETRGIDMLRKGQVEIGSLSFLQHLLDYDGSQRSKRGTANDGTRHHFELARCFIIAADVVRSVYFPEAPDVQEKEKPPALARPGVTWQQLAVFRQQEREARDVVIAPDLYAAPPGLYDSTGAGWASPW